MKTKILLSISLCLFFAFSTTASVTIRCPENIDLGCNPRKIPKPKPNKVEYNTDCRKKAKVVHVEDILIKQGCQFTIERIYKVTDRCGNMDFCTQLITWTEDKEAPVFRNCDKVIDLGCNAAIMGNVPPADPSTVEVTDNCGNPIVELIDESRKKDGCTIFLSRTYLATDECGNKSKCTLNYKWTEDTEAPIIRCTNIELGCNPTSIPEPDPEGLEIKENCCLSYVRHVGDVVGLTFGCRHIIYRTYIAEDCCGNRDTCRQFITWTEDTTPPDFISCPQDLDLGCNPDPSDILVDNSVNAVRAEDDCGEVDIRLGETIIENDGCSYKRTQTWIATDACGNQSTCSRTITYTLDENPPIITRCPPDLYLGCSNDPDFEFPEPDLSLLVFSDDCEAIVTVDDGTDVVVVGCEARMIRTYFVTDQCGNADTCSQEITWTIDDIPPVFTLCPPDLDLGCISDPTDIIVDNSVNAVRAEDNCGEVEIRFKGSVLLNTGCSYKRIQTWVATDPCGNETECHRVISYTLDGNPPIITRCPPDLYLGCSNDPDFEFPEPDLSLVVFSDDCEAIVTVDDGVDIVVVGCEARMIRTYFVTDHCGNADTCSQEITWTIDDIPPVFTLCPPDLDLGCISDPTDIIVDNSVNAVRAEDNCGEVEIRFEGSVLLNTGCSYKRIQTWVATDPCGNETECHRVISYLLSESELRITSCPPDRYLGCAALVGYDIPEPDLDLIQYEGGCDVTIEVQDGIDIVFDDCIASYVRTYILTDACGNTAECFQWFTWSIDDVVPGLILCPEGMDYGCVREMPDIPELDPYDMLVRDHCGIEEQLATEQLIELDNCSFVLRRWYIATDFCGQSTICFADYTWTLLEEEITDIPFPDDIDVICGNEPPIPVFDDPNACGVGIPELVDIVYVGNCSTNNCTILRTWIKRDCFGNTEIHVQTITITCNISSRLRNEKYRGNEDGVDLTLGAKLYPNPGVDLLNIEWQGLAGMLYDIQVINIEGKEVFRQQGISDRKNMNLRIDAYRFNAGVYFVHIKSSDKSFTNKWIKTK